MRCRRSRVRHADHECKECNRRVDEERRDSHLCELHHSDYACGKITSESLDRLQLTSLLGRGPLMMRLNPWDAIDYLAKPNGNDQFLAICCSSNRNIFRNWSLHHL
jgi:hypothetical protein